MRVALHWEASAAGRVRCTLCPNRCSIAEGKTGTCRVRMNQGGKLQLPFYARASSVAVDPIEKKPLYHFHPGSAILSVGFVGCSLRCRFCQNWRISQSTDAPTEEVSPEQLVSVAQREGSFGISYTYSEPLVHFEYVLDSAQLARAAGLKNVLVTNGYLLPGPTDEILPWVDAANVDLKAFDPAFYKEETGGDLEEVKRFIGQAVKRIHLEVTTLVIPTKNDDPAQVEGIARFLAALDPGIPLHLSCYYPQYRYNIAPTPPEAVRRLAAIARRHLRYVYVGNAGPGDSDTACPSCGNLLVRRVGYRVRVEGIRDGSCSKCGARVPIMGV